MPATSPPGWQAFDTNAIEVLDAIARVEEARGKAPGVRARQDAVYVFMRDMCGDRPGYEEALRALYRGDAAQFSALIAAWPGDIRHFIGRLTRE